MAGWLVVWLAGWLVGWLVGWLAGWLVGFRKVWAPLGFQIIMCVRFGCFLVAKSQLP